MVVTGMAMRGLGSALIGGLLLSIGAAAPARAESRVTSFATFMHIGPGHQYAVTDELQTRTTVDVLGCQSGWCQINYGGVAGWVEQRMLVQQAQPAAAQASTDNCVDFARTGWPHTGDHERVCLPAAGAVKPAR